MAFLIAILVLFIIISVYFFFRAERFQRLLNTANRENKLTQKENKTLYEAMAITFGHHEEFLKQRLSIVKQRKELANDSTKELDLISPLIQNYALIAKECLKSQNQLFKTIQKCYMAGEVNRFNELQTYIKTKDKVVQRMWSSNHLKGFLSLAEALVIEQEQQLLPSRKAQSVEEVNA